MGNLNNSIVVSLNLSQAYVFMVTDDSKSQLPHLSQQFQQSQLCRLRQELDAPLEVSVKDQIPVPETKAYKILVVDDSGLNREILAAQVQAEGYQAATAKDGQQAIQMIQTGTFDLILLDII
ncbi:MAG: response regulator, partial [Waterburya sp.]